MQQERVATSTRPRQEVSSLADKRSQRRGCPAPATRECMPCTLLYNKQQDFKSLTSDFWPLYPCTRHDVDKCHTVFRAGFLEIFQKLKTAYWCYMKRTSNTTFVSNTGLQGGVRCCSLHVLSKLTVDMHET